MTISQNTQTTNRIATATLSELLSKINSVPGAGGSGGGGNSFETCEVTFNQVWSEMYDPMLIECTVVYYNVGSDGTITNNSVHFNPADDFLPLHTISFTALKNIPFYILVNSSNWSVNSDGSFRYDQEVSAEGGNMNRKDFASGGGFVNALECIPTGDSAVFGISL